ncbi:MAG: stalk domain-containing protein [Bacillota bacterium]
MAKKIKVLVLLTMLIFLLGSMLPAGAFDGFKTLKAFYQNYKIVVDGRQLVTEEEPFVVDGRTYVPVRVIGEAVGANVEWDNANGRVLITTNKELSNEKYQEAYQAGFSVGKEVGKVEALIEAQGRLSSEASKKKDYEKGYKDGQAKGDLDGFKAGEYDFDWGRINSWSRAIDTDTEISRAYRLSGNTDDYIEGFLDGYRDAFKEAYSDGYYSYDLEDEGYEDGFYDGYYDGYRKGRLDANRNSNYNDSAPTRRTIIDDYRLDDESKNYRDGFIEGYWENYYRGYEDGYDGNEDRPYRKWE